MVTIKNVYLYFSKEKFHTTEYFKLKLSNNGEITKLYYGDPESSKELVKKNDKEFFRREIYRNRETIIKKYLSESNACHDFILFDFLKSSTHDEAHKIELKNRCLFDMYEKDVDSIEQLYNMFNLFGLPNKYISTNVNTRENTIVVDVFSNKITVDVVRNKRMNICTLEGTLNDFSMRLWVIVSLFWKLMEHKQDLQEIGIIEEDYSDSDILNFLKV
jgi:hypothetical protein